MPDPITNINTYTNVIVGNGIKSPYDSPFCYCTNIVSITLPSSLEKINTRDFYNCTSLTSITIPSSVTSIGRTAFDSCSRLASVTFADTSKSWKVVYGSNTSTISVSNATTNATYLVNTYSSYTWTKNG